MIFDYVSIGGGVIGFTFIENLIKNISKNKTNNSKIYNFAIIDNDLDNFPGGVAYGFKNSLHGYFNNPLRLAPVNFIEFIKKNNEIKKCIIDHLKKNGGKTDKDWIEENKKLLFNPKSDKFMEIYLPRVSFAFWLNYKFNKLINKIHLLQKKNININLFFLQGKVVDIKKINNHFKEIISEKNLFRFYKFYIVGKNYFLKPNFIDNTKSLKFIYSKNTSIGIGIPPPSLHGNEKLKENKYYLWDFYSEGSTNNLINKIQHNPKKNIRIFFVGFKAGLLEALPELNNLFHNSKKKLSIHCISPTLKSLQKAELSKNKYKLKYFNKKNLKNFYSAKNIYNGILSEFDIGIKFGFNRYDVWTEILKTKILNKAISKLSKREIKNYNLNYFHKIRSLTRYTYSKPIIIKDKMIKTKKLNVIETKVNKIIYKSNSFRILTPIGDFKADIVINVSGPTNISDKDFQLKIINNLKNRGIKFNKSGIVVNNEFALPKIKNLYSTGIITSGFNKDRKTIIDAIIQNSIIASNVIYKNLISSNKIQINSIYEKFFLKNKKFNSTRNYIKKGGILGPKNIFNLENENITIDLNEIKKNNNHSVLTIPLKIIIDGKAGSGKSTIAELFALYFNSIAVDTGYILKYFSKIIRSKNINYADLKENKIKIIFNNIQLNNLIEKDLDSKKYRYILSKISKNQYVRKYFNKKILEFSRLFDTYILTGRDTGYKVFSRNKNVNKFFFNTNNKIAAKRKSNIKSLKMLKIDTTERNESDKQNLIYGSSSILINNNHNNKYKTFGDVMARLNK
tara:strand:- start:1612 stop:3990 length:2379 start_codon:yes stop_codon:yes gene_type:complete